MEKLQNALNHFRKLLGLDTKVKTAQTQQNPTTEQDLVIVTDYAVAQGAECMKPTGNKVLDRYHWMAREDMVPLYCQRSDGQVHPVYYLESMVGMAPVLNNCFFHGFKVRGGYLTVSREGKQENVYFPQKRVSPALNDYLTAVAVYHAENLPQNEFGSLPYTVSAFGGDVSKGIQKTAYYYRGQAYLLRVDKNNDKDKYQWFTIDPVVAEYDSVHEQINCSDILFADHFYNQERFIKDLKNSTLIKYQIPLVVHSAQQKNEKPESQHEQI